MPANQPASVDTSHLPHHYYRPSANHLVQDAGWFQNMTTCLACSDFSYNRLWRMRGLAISNVSAAMKLRVKALDRNEKAQNAEHSWPHLEQLSCGQHAACRCVYITSVLLAQGWWLPFHTRHLDCLWRFSCVAVLVATNVEPTQENTAILGMAALPVWGITVEIKIRRQLGRLHSSSKRKLQNTCHCGASTCKLAHFHTFPKEPFELLVTTMCAWVTKRLS